VRQPTRRDALKGIAGVSAAAIGASRARALPSGEHERTIVVGAGVFGVWTAIHLQRLGRPVLLLDAWGPAHTRSSSGGESRMTRAAYGADEIYTRMALNSLEEWKALSRRADLPIFHRTGVLFFFPDRSAYLAESLRVHRALGLTSRHMDRREMRTRFPAIDFDGVEAGIYEPDFGALMARRGVQTLMSEFIAKGGLYRRAAIAPPRIAGGRIEQVVTKDGERISGSTFVFAAGAWLPKLFPELLNSRIFPTRQEIFFFATPAGDPRYEVGRLPGWADFNGGDLYYGFPDLEGRGFKIARDTHGPPIDPDTAERLATPSMLADVRKFMSRRFSALAGAPLNEARVCQYENSANGDFLIDRHPAAANAILVGGGSGHGFKHGPAVGQYAAALLTESPGTVQPRFSLASKSEKQAREVH